MTTLTRRRLIQMVGATGGASAAYSTLSAMGMIATPAAYAGAPDLPAGSGEGESVAVLGAGVAGLVAAYELGRAGYAVTVLEAADFVGGRCRTYRGGDVVREVGGTQDVAFDEDPELYFNAGPARLPYHHQATLSYCHDLGVALEPIVNDNRGAFFHDEAAFGGEPVRGRRLMNDTRGTVSELLSKAIDKGALDEELSGIDKERFLEFLSRFGDLQADGTYAGSSRAGYREPPGANLAAAGATMEPVDMNELLASDFWGYKMHFGEGFTQAATMMQPVGGMDRIAAALAERVGERIELGARVTEIRRTGGGARVVYADASGAEQALEVDHVVVTIPFSVLSGIASDFSPEVVRAVEACGYTPAGKAAFQAERRFWERDHQIYGGISWTNADITQIWYPTAGFGTGKGVVVGAYIWSDEIGARFGAMPFDERLEMVRTQASRIHPTFAEDTTAGVTIGWGQVPHILGGWADWSDEARADAYPAVARADGPFHFAGEHVSHLTGWQEGSVLSAQDAVRAISEITLSRSN